MADARKLVSRRTVSVRGSAPREQELAPAVRARMRDPNRGIEGPLTQEGPKFSTTEVILGSLLCIFIDILAAIGDFFSFSLLGDIVQWASWLLFSFWFTIKGCKVTSSLLRRFIIPLAVDLIPLFPTVIFTFAATVYMENHPEKFAVVQVIEKVANKVPVKK